MDLKAFSVETAGMAGSDTVILVSIKIWTSEALNTILMIGFALEL